MTATSKKIDENTSRVFTFLKVLCIFMVLIGHFFKEYGLFWIPVTAGLLVFSFSSGYFTSIKYTGSFSKKVFWFKKFERLGVNLIVINTFLLMLFFLQDRQGIWSWYSLVNVLGLNGFLNWFRIIDPSPFGAGMWFFTLLIVFYFVYPFLNKMNHICYSVFAILFVITAFYLNKHIIFGHALWLTACGFVIGVWAGKNNIRVSPNISLLFAFSFFTTMIGSNLLFQVRQFNFFFILFFSMSGIYACLSRTLPDSIYRGSLFFSGALFEIYLIHSYLFIEATKIRIMDFIISVVIIVLISKCLSFFTFKIHSKIRLRF